MDHPMTDQDLQVARGLVQQLASHPNSLVRLILLEASRFGMPPNLIALLDEIGAMLGFHPALPSNQLGYLAGPLAVWRTDPRMPTMERSPELEGLAQKQRADVIFGQAGTAMVGPAEIVVAMGNLIDGTMPDAYRDLFHWAGARTMSELDGIGHQQWCTENKWPFVGDDDVLKPAGRLYGTYVEVAQSIRRMAASAVHPEHHPRQVGLSLGAALHRLITGLQAEAEAAGLTDRADRLREHAELVRDYIDQQTLALPKAEQPTP
jgi:hypothetical protein